MKRKISIAMIVTIMLITIFTLSACGRSTGNYENDRQQNGVVADPTGEGVRHAQDEGTFIISTPFGNLARVQESADAFQQTLASQGQHIEFNILSHTHEETQEHNDLLLSKFAAGVGPDVFLRSQFMLYPFIENGFLADIYTIIDQSSDFTREDFFTNVLSGLEVNGNLYMLPLNFSIDFIGINATAPLSFINRFAALDRITPTELTNLYIDLISQYPEWAEFALINGYNANQAFIPELNQAIDFAGRTASLANIIGLLENLRPAFAGNQRFETPFFNWHNPAEDFQVKQERYVFSRITGPAGIYALIELQDPFFVNYMPLADESRQLVNRGWGMEMVVSHTANPNLAMGFIGQVISDTMEENIRFGIDMPILRQYFQQALNAGFSHTLTQMTLPPIVESESFAIELAIRRMETYSAWPSTTPIAGYMVPPWQFISTFFEFMEGDIPAYEAASQMEDAITTWLNEERPAIEPFVYIPPAELPDLPVRTLTIRNDNRHTGVIEQAAEAMNAAWRERDEPYIFQIEIEDHSWIDYEGMSSRAARLRTELMAGQGPDMFIMEPWMFLTEDHLDIHALTASGFLTDTNTLMDACPHTSRDEFFTNALEAFELNNGLYVFPVSFGFEYISVNAKLPQEFIDRFSQKNNISLLEMMDFYLDLMDTHGDEFGHLTFHTGSGITFSGNVLQTTMGGFIDFNNRTSYLTDPRFIETLELMDVIYADWDIPNTWGTTIGTADFLRDRAQEYVFFSITDGLNNFDAFFTAETPIFKHHIPLADDNGTLMLGPPGAHGQVWAGICITAAGDGDLAWEFTRHLIYAYANPIGRAALEPVFGAPNTWGINSLATPIKRSLFRDHAMRTFEETFDRFGQHGLQTFVGFDDDANRIQQFEAAVNRIATYNQQPMGMLSPMIPLELVRDHFEQFQLGLINAQAAAQRMHNAISLWLIE